MLYLLFKIILNKKIFVLINFNLRNYYLGKIMYIKKLKLNINSKYIPNINVNINPVIP